MVLLGSSITKKLLNYFFLNPQESLYMNEMPIKFGVDKRNLAKKIKELESEGLLKVQKMGNMKLYSLNKGYTFYDEYRKIVLKTVGIEEKVRQALKKVKGVKEAYIYGSYAKDRLESHSDIDILVVGDHNISLLQKELNSIQKEIGREINAVNIDEEEFIEKLKNKKSFVAGIVREKKIKVA